MANKRVTRRAMVASTIGATAAALGCKPEELPDIQRQRVEWESPGDAHERLHDEWASEMDKRAVALAKTAELQVQSYYGMKQSGNTGSAKLIGEAATNYAKAGTGMNLADNRLIHQSTLNAGIYSIEHARATGGSYDGALVNLEQAATENDFKHPQMSRDMSDSRRIFHDLTRKQIDSWKSLALQASGREGEAAETAMAALSEGGYKREEMLPGIVALANHERDASMVKLGTDMVANRLSGFVWEDKGGYEKIAGDGRQVTFDGVVDYLIKNQNDEERAIRTMKTVTALRQLSPDAQKTIEAKLNQILIPDSPGLDMSYLQQPDNPYWFLKEKSR